LAVKGNRSQKIEQLATFLSRELAQTRPDNTFTLSVISGTSVLALTRFSDSAATALMSVVRLFV
jgi:hypothetical protein